MSKPLLDAASHFFEISELAVLSLDELQGLWDSVPTEDQAYLIRVFEREADKRQVVEDIDESRMARYFLEQYRQTGFVPAGEVWVKLPPAAREQYKRPLAEPVDMTESVSSSTETKKPARQGKIPKPVFLLAVPFVCLLVFAAVRLMSGTGSSTPPRRPVTPTVTPTSTATMTPTVTPSPLPPTATPFALDGFDDAIAAGDRASRDYYPVQLQIFADPDTPPRVFIVQQQRVNVAEWQFDSNPDIVSWLRGMIVRPVLGVPFSQSNLALFRTLKPGSVFAVTMNTGDVLQYIYQDTRQVTRADTSLFRQDAPGLVLVLMGETFADGSPTDLRYVVRGAYPEAQEMSRVAANPAVPIPMQTAHLLNGMTLTVQDAYRFVDDTLPPDLGYAIVDLQLLSDAVDIPISTFIWMLEPSLTPGERFPPDGFASQHGNCAPLPTVLPGSTATCASIGFLVSRGVNEARLWAGSSPDTLTAFQIALKPVPEVVSVSRLDVQLRRVTYTTTTVTVTARLYNPTDTAIPITAAVFTLITGFVPNPAGTTVTPSFSPQTVAPESSLDITLEFPYAGEGYATLTLAERVWSVQIKP